jgi:hypothetical protein
MNPTNPLEYMSLAEIQQVQHIYSRCRARAHRWRRTRSIPWPEAFNQSAQKEGFKNSLQMIEACMLLNPAAIQAWRSQNKPAGSPP